MTKRQLAKRIVRWLLFLVAVAFVISGFGITEYRIVESLTFGLLQKNTAFRIHDSLWAPFAVLLLLHVFGSKLKLTD